MAATSTSRFRPRIVLSFRWTERIGRRAPRGEELVPTRSGLLPLLGRDDRALQPVLALLAGRDVPALLAPLLDGAVPARLRRTRFDSDGSDDAPQQRAGQEQGHTLHLAHASPFEFPP